MIRDSRIPVFFFLKSQISIWWGYGRGEVSPSLQPALFLLVVADQLGLALPFYR